MARYRCEQCGEDLAAAREGAAQVHDVSQVVEVRSPYAVVRHRRRWKVMLVCPHGHRNTLEGGTEDEA